MLVAKTALKWSHARGKRQCPPQVVKGLMLVPNASTTPTWVCRGGYRAGVADEDNATTVSVRHVPYHRQTTSVTCTVLVTP